MSEHAATGEMSEKKSLLLVVGAMAAFSMMAVFTRSAGASVFTVAAWRAIFVALVFGAWMLGRTGPASFKVDRQTLKISGWMGGALAIASATFVAGYAYTTVANTIFLHNLAPVAVFPLAWWMFREKPAPVVLTGTGIAVAGVAMLSGVSLFQVSHFASARFLVGDLLALVSALGYAGVLVMTRKARQADTPIVPTLFYAWSLAAVVLTGVALAVDTMVASPLSLVWILGLAVICTNVPFVLLNLGMRKVSAGMASVLSLWEVVFATILGVVVYSESLAPAGWLGGGLAVFGVLYAVRKTEDVEDASDEVLPAAAKTPRTLRAALALVVLNVAAVATLLGSGGALLAWWALVRLARMGPVLTGAHLSPAAAKWARFGAILVAGGAAFGALARTGAPDEGSALLLLAAAGVWLVDRKLAASEGPGRDPDVLGQVTLLAVVGMHGFGLLGHDASGWTSWIGRALVGIAAVEVIASAVRGTLHTAPKPPPLPGISERFASLLRPRGLVVVVVLWALGGLHAVPAGHVGIVERFGEPVTEAGAGLLVRMPPPLERVVQVDVGRAHRLQVLDAGTALLCGDQSMVSVDAVVHYAVRDPQAWAYGMQDPESVLVALSRSALVEVVGSSDADAVLTTGRAELESAATARVQSAAEIAGLGVEIHGISLEAARVPAPVLAAFLDVISADEERLTAINEARAYAAQVLPMAGGAAVESVSSARADAIRRDASTEADRLEFDALHAGGRAQPRLTRERLALEAAEAQLAPATVLVVPEGQRVWLDGLTLYPSETD
ncbi:MAG: EamA family transporter [Proteobacteria bacterium]|nr:EamA family transporter [Pseudomonadota bacterium]